MAKSVKASDNTAPARKHKKARDRKPRQERWTEILDVAARTFAEKGYDGTSLQEIANRTGILKGSIYYYINTKEDMLAHLLRQAYETGLRRIRPIAESTQSAAIRLAEMIRAHVEYVCTDRDRTAVFLHERKRLSPEMRRKFLGDESTYGDLFEKVIAEGQKEGSVPAELDPKLTAICLLGSLNATYQWFHHNEQYSVDEISNHFVATTLRGIVRAGSPTARPRAAPKREIDPVNSSTRRSPRT
jgi:AcrR family transcriptional regulator